MIEAAGIVVPAHDEETLLPACLAALQQAVRSAGIPVHVLVAADSCTDGTVGSGSFRDSSDARRSAAKGPRELSFVH